MNRPLIFRMALAAVVAVLTPTRSPAMPGDLDLNFAGFGSGGIIQDLGFTATAAAIDAQGRLVLVGTVAGTFHVQRRSGPRFLTVENQDIIIDSGQLGATAQALAIAPDGKIVVAGTLMLTDRQPNFAVAVLKPDLSLDTTFAGDGTTSSDFSGRIDNAYAVAVQSDGKIVLAGSAQSSSITGGDPDFAVERFNADGNLDRSFNGNGKFTLDVRPTGAIVGFDNQLFALAIQPDGKIVAGGYANAGNFGGLGSDSDFAVLRLNPNGSTDGDFGDGGLVTTDFGTDETVQAIAIAPDGKIVVVGGNLSGVTPDHIDVARYLPNGDLDETFDSDGKVTTAVDGPALGTSLVLQPDQKIVVAGLVHQPDRFVSVRYNANGSLDNTFGTGGKVHTTFNVPTGASAIALQSDGMLVAAGNAQAARYRWDGSLDAGGIANVVFDAAQTSSEVTALAVQNGQLLAAGNVFTADSDMALARFTQDRSGLDTTFGTDTPKSGHEFYGFFGQGESVQAMAFAPDGKIVVAGQLSTAHTDDMLVGRFNPDGTADIGCALKGFNGADLGFGTNTASAVAVTSDGKIYAAGTARGQMNNDFGLVRFANDCSIDRTDAAQLIQYKLDADLGGDETLNGMVLDSNERPILAGASNFGLVLVRVILTRGHPLVLVVPAVDSTFGTDGQAGLGVAGPSVAAGLARQSDGKLIAAGTMTISASTTDFFLARFTPDGQLDTTFGDAGLAFANLTAATARAVTVRKDDSIAVVGNTTTSNDMRFAVAQFTPSGQLDTRLHGTGTATLKLGPDGADVAQAVTFIEPNHLAIGGYSSVFGNRQFTLVSFETTAAVASACVGDCNGDGSVTVDELLVMVNLALEQPGAMSCDAGDANHDGQVTIDEILIAVNALLSGCPAMG